MKIGVITWFTYANYGTKLQAIALQQVLREMGHEPYLIYFDPECIVVREKEKISDKLKNPLFKVVRKGCIFLMNKNYKKAILQKEKKMADFLSKCQFSNQITTEEEFVKECNKMDVLVFGSDQIWNPFVFHPFYYADFSEIKVRRIAYAPSFGVMSLQSSDYDKYRKALSRFYKLSAREENGVQIIEELLNQKTKRVVDPTLLLDSNQWDSLVNLKETNEQYVLLYMLSDNYHHIKAAVDFAKKKNLKLKVIPCEPMSYCINGEIIADAGPAQFVQLIKNCSYMITDSFHGLVFSLLYQKEVYILTRFSDEDKKSQNSRIYQIVKEFRLQNHLQVYGTSEIQFAEPIQYDSISEKLSELRKDSLEYLKNSILEAINEK